jgi:LemA protein
MSTGVIVLIVVVAVIVLLLLFVFLTYNSLIRARLRVREAWSGIDVQLKRRASLIPNLVETVRGYASHEQAVFENVTRARSQLQSAGTAGEAAQANNMLTQALRTLFAVAENYPQLRASENFQSLQDDLDNVEQQIAYSRQFYNANVLDYNQKIQVFPNVIFANMFGFQGAEFFEAEEEARAEVPVSFTRP